MSRWQTRSTKKLLNKHVFILGGTKGIGFAVAEACLESGAKVTILGSTQTTVKIAVAKLRSANPFYAQQINDGVACDLSNPTDIEQDLETAVSSASTSAAPLDHLVQCAGPAHCAMGESLDILSPSQIASLAHWRTVVPVIVAKVAARYLPKDNTLSLVLTGRSPADNPLPGRPLVNYFVAALKGLAKGLALDLKPTRVNIVEPGVVVETGLYDHLSAEERAGLFGYVAAAAPVGKAARPEDVAEAYLWLLKDSNATGVSVMTSGGMLLL